MKKSSKKILAGVALSIIGAGTLAGCSLTEEQQATIDMLVGKADEIIELVDNNMSYQNSKLSKEEAAEKILLARNTVAMGGINQIKMNIEYIAYDGIFTNIAYCLQGEHILRNIDNKREYYGFAFNILYDDIESTNIIKSDYNEDKHYKFVSNEYSQLTSDDADIDWASIFVTFDPIASALGYNVEISPENIINIEILENGYKFTLIDIFTTSISAERFQTDIIILDNKITSVKIKDFCYDFEEGVVEDMKYDAAKLNQLIASNYNKLTDCVSYEMNFVYQYDNIDFIEMDAKIAEIESEYNAE